MNEDKVASRDYFIIGLVQGAMEPLIDIISPHPLPGHLSNLFVNLLPSNWNLGAYLEVRYLRELDENDAN
jgi:hypothetical protein